MEPKSIQEKVREDLNYLAGTNQGKDAELVEKEVMRWLDDVYGQKSWLKKGGKISMSHITIEIN